MDMQHKTLLTPAEVGKELWGEATDATRMRAYRYLREGLFDEIAERNNCPVIKRGNRYYIPMALIKAMRGEN